MKVLIVGGGIAGCACAALLLKYKIAEVTLIERAPEFRNIGYVMGLWGTGRKVLKELGVDSRIKKKGCVYAADMVFDHKGRLIKAVTLEEFKVLETLVVKRNDVHQGLFQLLNAVDVRFNTTCTNIEQRSGKVYVTFNNKKRETFDLVIGADGIGSSVRDLVFGKGFLHRYGWRVWMWWLPRGYKHSNSAISYYGSGKICAALPYFNESVAILIAKISPESTASVAIQPENLFEDFCDDAQEIIKTAPVDTELYHDDIGYIEMPLWYKERVVLIGDAQHAASPVIGMGASMAMEDASVLVEELRRGSCIDESLSNFASRREKRIRRFYKIVTQMNRWTMTDGILAYVRNKVLVLIPTRYFVNIMRRFIEMEV